MRLRSRPERVQREGDCAVGQGCREAGSCDHCFEGRRCGVDLVDGAGEALGSTLCLPAAELHLDGCPVSVGHRQNRIDLTPVGVAIVLYVSAQGLRVDEQVVDNCGLKEETERFQVRAQTVGVGLQSCGCQRGVRQVIFGRTAQTSLGP